MPYTLKLYHELIQSTNMALAIGSKREEGKVIHAATEWNTCKDYIQDAYQKYVRNQQWEPGWKPSTKIIGDTSKVCLLAYHPSWSKSEHWMYGKRIRVLIRKAEDLLGIGPKTTMSMIKEFDETGIPTEGNPYAEVNGIDYSGKGILMFTGSRTWLKHPTMISLYCLMIRTGCAHNIEDDFFTSVEKIIYVGHPSVQARDRTYWRLSVSGVRYLIERGHNSLFGKYTAERIRENYPSGKSLHGWGIKNFSTTSHLADVKKFDANQTKKRLGEVRLEKQCLALRNFSNTLRKATTGDPLGPNYARL